MKMLPPLRRLCFALALTALALSCKSLASKADGPAPDPEKALNDLRDLSVAIRSVEADGKVELFEGGQGDGGLGLLKKDRHERGELIWVVQKPSSATFELNGPTGLIALATLDGKEFRYYNPHEKRAMQGPVTSERLRSVLPLAITPEELAPILCGTPLLFSGPHGKMKFDEKVRRWRLIVKEKGTDRLQVLWFEPKGLLYRVRVLDSKRSVRYEATFLAWERHEKTGLPYPSFIKIEQPKTNSKITLKLHGEPSINGTIDPGVFKLPFPKDTPVEQVE